MLKPGKSRLRLGRSPRMGIGAVSALAAAAAMMATGIPAQATAGQSVVDPADAHNSMADAPAAVTESCFWGMPGGPADGLNVLGPETNVTYWFSRFQLPAGASVQLRGDFPHARFMSLTSYGTVAGQQGTALAGLSDYEIDPDKGSVNPFRPGAKRDTKHRTYTVTLSGQVDPGSASRAKNTFYVGQAGQTDQTQTIEIILRVYRPDHRRGLAGTERLPEPTVKLAGRTTKAGKAACDAVKVESGVEKLDMSKIGVPTDTYLQLLNLPGAKPTHPALKDIPFRRSFNGQYALMPYYLGTSEESKIASLPTDLRPGLYPTPANAYLRAEADRSFGPDPDGHNILVLRGKAPTHPTTFRGDKVNNSAGKQVRYWALCNYGSLIAKPSVGPVNTDCLFDEEIPVDRKGFYTIVVSLAEDKPKNAQARCGVAWMDWTRKGDGITGGHDRLINLSIRQQLPAPSFAQSVDKVLTPGTEKAVMGDYYPVGTYTTKAEFQKRGC